MAVPYTFGSATTSIPLSQLDSNFATTITLGNTAIQLGNTVTTLNNMTLGNVTISSGTSNLQTNVANATGVLIEANGGTGTTTGYYGFKNRIINGAMVISQRQGTSSFTPATGDYLLDRWNYQSSQASKFTVQQNAGSVTPPVGFSNYMGFTVASAVSVGASEFFYIRQPIEGFNFSDMAWGTANAKTVTLSFQVYSSLTGTFGGSILNSATSRSYPFSYTIGSANTWTQISVTIAGDTSGTWIGATNGVGVYVYFSLGMGSTYSGTAGAWASALYASATSAVSVVGTASATFYITGVQLEKGSTATSFDYRPYGTELQLCQRYFSTSFQNGGTPASPNNLAVNQTGLYFINGSSSFSYSVPMRTAPTVTCFAPLTSPAINNVRVANTGSIVAGTVGFIGERSFTQFGPTDGIAYQFGYTASAEL